MKVDYSTFEEDESLYGKVNIIDGDSEIKISSYIGIYFRLKER